jgi:hypothetical protein
MSALAMSALTVNAWAVSASPVMGIARLMVGGLVI